MTSLLRRREVLGSAAVGIGTLGALSGLLGDPEYVIHDIDFGQPSEPLSLNVEVTDPEIMVGSPGRVQFEVTNMGETQMELYNWDVIPFGVLEAQHIDSPVRMRLNSPLYKESKYVVESGASFKTHRTELSQTLDPGESVSAKYSILGDRVPRQGQYEIESPRALLIYKSPTEDGVTEETPTVTFDLTSRGFFSL